VKQITDIFLNFSNFLIGFTELQYSCTHKSTHKNEGGNNRLYSKNEKKKINIAYFWHIELSSDQNICLIQEFYNIYVIVAL